MNNATRTGTLKIRNAFAELCKAGAHSAEAVATLLVCTIDTDTTLALIHEVRANRWTIRDHVAAAINAGARMARNDMLAAIENTDNTLDRFNGTHARVKRIELAARHIASATRAN